MTKDIDPTDNHSQQQPEEIPPSNPLSIDSGRPTLRIAVSWLFILATVTLTQVQEFTAAKATPDIVRDLSLQFMGKYLVGTKQLLGNSQALLNSRFRSMRQELQKGQSTRRQLLIIPILAELSGKKTALAELNRLAAHPAGGRIDPDFALFLQLYRDGSSSLEPQQRLSIQRYGWLGQLALSQDKSSSDPARRAILHSALRTVVVMVVLSMGIVSILVAGLMVLALAIVLFAKGRLRGRLAMPDNPHASLLEAFAIYLTGFIALPAVVSRLFPNSRPEAISLAILAVVIAIFWPRFRGADWKNYRRALGWYAGSGFFREIAAGIVGYIAGFPLLMAAVAFVALVAQRAGKMPVHPIVYQIGRGPLYLLFWTVLACVWAPVVEETFFRGALFGYLRMKVQWAVSGLVVALLFAIIHPQGWVAIPVLATIGFNLSMIREWRGSIIASITAHALNNASALLMLILIVF